MKYEITERPIHSHLTFRGNRFDEAMIVALKHRAQVIEAPWTTCTILNPLEGGSLPIILANDEDAFKLGEIGLAYVLYRFRYQANAKDARQFYRTGQWGLLNTILSQAMTQFKLHHELRPKYYFTELHEELMGILTLYSSVLNQFLLEIIEEADLSKRLARWMWRPTEMRFNLRGGIVKRMFHYGIRIMNGETGHRALSFHSSLWSQSLNGLVYEFNTPVVYKGYARHMPTRALLQTVEALGDTLKENKLAEAFEQFAGLPGTWVTGAFSRHLGSIKSRDSTKEKLDIVFTDNIAVYKPESALDAIYQLLAAGAEINVSAARAAQATVNEMIADVMKMEIKPTGEVIPDA